MLSNPEHHTCLQETLRDLQEDTLLLRLSIKGIDDDLNQLTLDCLLRLTDYLQQHVNDICVLCKNV